MSASTITTRRAEARLPSDERHAWTCRGYWSRTYFSPLPPGPLAAGDINLHSLVLCPHFSKYRRTKFCWSMSSARTILFPILPGTFRLLRHAPRWCAPEIYHLQPAAGIVALAL